VNISFLGTGTSVGVPFLGCPCLVCHSTNPKNKRLRTSAFIEFDGLHEDLHRGLLIDSSPDLRQQMFCLGLRYLEGIFYTHPHADHVNGLDDLRPFNFRQKAALECFADRQTALDIQSRFPYAFGNLSSADGGSPPRLNIREVTPGGKFKVGGVDITPISIFHGSRTILGLRIKNLAYLTDCSAIPAESMDLLRGLDVMVISALRHTSHPNHLTIREAVTTIESLAPKQAFITHIAHDLEHEETNELLKQISSCQITLAYDGLSLDF